MIFKILNNKSHDFAFGIKIHLFKQNKTKNVQTSFSILTNNKPLECIAINIYKEYHIKIEPLKKKHLKFNGV